MSSRSTPFQCIDPSEAEKLLRSRDALVLDTRDVETYRRGHIRGAQHVSISELAAVLRGTPKSTPLLIYCYRGFASREYAQVVVDLGFIHVYSLDGGYEAWLRKPRAPRKVKLSPELQKWLSAEGFASGKLDAVIANAMTPLMRASHAGDVAIVRELLAAGASLEAQNLDGNTALWLACVGESLDVIDVLVEAGIDLNHANVNGATSLMYAASAGKHEVVARLLAHGVDPRPETPEGFTAMDMAATIECLSLLRNATRKLTPARDAVTADR